MARHRVQAQEAHHLPGEPGAARLRARGLRRVRGLLLRLLESRNLATSRPLPTTQIFIDNLNKNILHPARSI